MIALPNLWHIFKANYAITRSRKQALLPCQNYSTFSNNILASFTDGKASTLTELVYTIFTLPDLMYLIEVPGSLHMSATAIGEDICYYNMSLFVY